MSTVARPRAAAAASGESPARGLTGRMIVASALLLLLIGAAFAVLLRSVDDLRDSARGARKSQEVLATANELERLVVDLETGVRGFVITGREQFLQPWSAARRTLPARAAALERLADGNTEQAQIARDLGNDARSYIQDYGSPLIASARRGEPTARSVAATAEGKRRVDAMRRDFDRFISTERRLADAREQRSDDSARRAATAAVVALALSIVLVLLFTAYLTRAIVQPVRRAAQMAGVLAAGDLSTRMPAKGVGEIGHLERAFNTMAGSLEQNRAQLAASRARVVATADETRRQIERDLHDGAQQRLVSLALRLRAAEAAVPPDLGEVHAELARVGTELNEVLEELREISRGIHPAILSEGGLGPALRTLARRSAIPVELDVQADARLPEPVEVTAYFVVSEALTNAAKHANASGVHVDVASKDGVVRLAIRDDGVGGADPTRGSGLIGLKDRVEATGGTMTVESRSGEGTTLVVELPVEPDPVPTPASR